MISGGLDYTIKLFDLRNLKQPKSPTPSASFTPAVAELQVGRSVNSAYFSPSGQYVVATTMNDKLEILKDFHLAQAEKKKPAIVQTWKSIAHDNRTGRWLSTFMARFHPTMDIFCCGSMKKPRQMEIFSPSSGLLRAVRGDALTAVASRCCFHPSTDKLIMIGGNSSGRVTIVR